MRQSVLEAIRDGQWDFEPEHLPEDRYDSTSALPGTEEKLAHWPSVRLRAYRFGTRRTAAFTMRPTPSRNSVCSLPSDCCSRGGFYVRQGDSLMVLTLVRT